MYYIFWNSFSTVSENFGPKVQQLREKKLNLAPLLHCQLLLYMNQ